LYGATLQNATSQTITIHVPVITASDTLVCAGSVTTLQATGSLNYTWNPSANLNQATGSSVTATPFTNENYTVLGIDSNGCGASSSMHIEVIPKPQINYSVNLSSPCPGASATFTINSNSPIVNCNLATANGQADQYVQFANPQTSFSFTSVYSSAGTFTTHVTFLDTNQCTTIDSATLIVYPSPVAAFSYSPQPVSILNSQVQFVNATTGAATYYWNFGDNTAAADTSLLYDPSYTYYNVGPDTVYLVVTSVEGCRDSVANILEVIDHDAIVPNVFTPNGDGVNDLFYIKGFNLSDFKCEILNRWGKKVYEWSNYREGWNGKDSNGNTLNEGTYYYLLTYTSAEAKALTRKGFVELIR
jgi:gliding motility-associated-like protein